MNRFRDRTEAGQVLASKLTSYAGHPGLLILALPRGGVPVAFEVAKQLQAPMDIFVVRKLGLPRHEELAMGAIASGGIRVLNDAVVAGLGIAQEVIERVTAAEKDQLIKQERIYRGERLPLDLQDKTLILVDDGLATGSSMRAAVAAVRQKKPARVVVAVPVASRDTYREFQAEVDEIVCPLAPEAFYAVGQWYDDFSQTSDQEVHQLLCEAQQFHAT